MTSSDLMPPSTYEGHLCQKQYITLIPDEIIPYQ